MRALVFVAALLACDKGEKKAPTDPPSVQAKPAPISVAPPSLAPSDGSDVQWDTDYPNCPRDKGPRKTAAKLIGTDGRIVPHERGYVWHYRRPKEHAMQLFDADGNHLEKIPGALIPTSVISFDDVSWYVAPCEKGTCDARGFGHELQRVDRSTGKSEVIFGPEPAFVFGQPHGDYFYWATASTDTKTGDLRRVPRRGTKVETIWSGHGVASVILSNNIAFLADQHALFAVPLDGGKPRELVSGLKDARGIALDKDRVYVVDRGDAENDGRILAVNQSGGNVASLATGLRLPTVVAVDTDGQRIFFMGDRSGDVWAMRRDGSNPAVLIPAPSADWSCHASRWLHADRTGLRWVRMNSDSKRGGLFMIDRSMLADPVKQWQQYVQHGSGAQVAP